MSGQSLVEPGPDLREATLVVGGAGALGRGLAQRFAEDGRAVATLDKASAPFADIPHVVADISDRNSVAQAFCGLDDILADRHWRLASLVVASGVLRPAPFATLTTEDVHMHLDVNLVGAFHVCQQAASRMMARGGRIVCLSSIHAHTGVPGRTAYAMSKAGTEAMVRAMAAELSTYAIRVNALAPGAVSAGMTPDPASSGAWGRETPSGRVAMAGEVAAVARFLLSDDASFLSGQTITLDGGASTTRLCP